MKRSTGEKMAAKSYSIFQREKAMSGLEFSALSNAMGMMAAGVRPMATTLGYSRGV